MDKSYLKYSKKNYNNGVKGESSSPSPLIIIVLFLDMNKFKLFEVTISFSSTYLLFDISGYVDEIEKEPAV